MSRWNYGHWRHLLGKENACNDVYSIMAQNKNCVWRQNCPVGRTNEDISRNTCGFNDEQWMILALLEESRKQHGHQCDRLTSENLQQVAYDPYFPLITASVCTHSLSTPSIGTMTSDEEDGFVPFHCNEGMDACFVKGTAIQYPSTDLNNDSIHSLQLSASAVTSTTESRANDDVPLMPYKLFASDVLTTAIQSCLKEIREGMDIVPTSHD